MIFCLSLMKKESVCTSYKKIEENDNGKEYFSCDFSSHFKFTWNFTSLYLFSYILAKWYNT